MRLVIIESPFAGDIPANIAYARAAVRDCLQRVEAPIASHLLFTQDGVLRDDVPGERKLGIDAGLAWYRGADASVFYLDRGMSGGMAAALEFVEAHELPVERRFLSPRPAPHAVHQYASDRQYCPDCLVWARGFPGTRNDDWVCERPEGRLGATLNRRPPTPGAPYESTFAGLSLAFYATMEGAQAGAEHYYRFHTAQAAQRGQPSP